MNQTNVVTESTKPSRRQPNSNTPQPRATPSTKRPRTEAVDEQFSQEEPELTRDEAKELLRKCQECAKEVKGASTAFRRAVCQVHVQGVLKVLKMGDKLFRTKVSLAVPNSHRSNINRLYLAAVMDAKLNLPPGVVNEYALRILRTKVPEENWATVVAHGKKKMGLYGKIQADTIVEAARELGYLKLPVDTPSQAKDGESVGDDEKNHESEDNRNQQQEADAKPRIKVDETKYEAVQAWLEKLIKLQKGLEKLLNQFDEHPTLIQEVVDLLKHQYQQLDDLLNAIG